MAMTDPKHRFIVIKDIGGDMHAIDPKNIVTMTNSIPTPIPEGFVMGTDFTTIITTTPAGILSYHTGESLRSILVRLKRIEEGYKNSLYPQSD